MIPEDDDEQNKKPIKMLVYEKCCDRKKGSALIRRKLFFMDCRETNGDKVNSALSYLAGRWALN